LYTVCHDATKLHMKTPLQKKYQITSVVSVHLIETLPKIKQ
jgi:hypothetical protein